MKSIRAAIVVPATVLLALAWAPSGAAAQFTAALTPPPPRTIVDTAARADSSRKEAKQLQERMTSIKEWVDSAAAALAAQPAAVPPVPPDTARMPRMPVLPDTSQARQPRPDTSGSHPRRPPG